VTVPCVLGVAQFPMRTRLPDYTYADLLGRIAYQAVEDSGVDPGDLDGLILSLPPTTTLGVDEAQYWGLAHLPGSRHVLGRVHAAAASGLQAFRLACAWVSAGRARRVLVVGADLADEVANLAGALGQLHDPFTERQVVRNAITSAAVQASAYMAAHKVTSLELASVVVKNRGNGVRNQYAQLRQAVTGQEVADSPLLSWPIRRLDCAPRSSGAAAILVGAEGTGRGGRRTVRAAGFGAFAGARMIGSRMVPGAQSYLDGADLAAAAAQAYAVAGIRDPRTEIGCAELYAAFGIIELLSIEALGLCPKGEAARRIADGEFHADAALPVNPSGGATCGNPLASTGLIRVIEATLQLWGEAGEKQVELRQPTVLVTAIAGAFQSHEVGVLAA